MDVKLKIYKAAERTVLANMRSFDVSTEQSVQIPFTDSLQSNVTYEVAADFYTDADFYLELRNGSTVVATLDDTGNTHHISSKTFLNTASGITSLTLHLIANRSGVCNARVESIVISRYVSYPNTDPRYVAEKWEFHDTVMGERYLTFTAKSPTPIDWRVNDYAIYRGQRYYLNYIPSCVQRGRSGDVGDAFTYESVKMEDEQGKLGDCMMLDVTPTTGDYIASEGTNYTGSSVFTLYCAETVVEMVDYDGNTHQVAMSPVEYIGGVIQANLNRLYPRDGWRVQVNPGLPHLDDKVVSFNKQYVIDALATIHDTWDLDFIIIGRTIYIGYTLNNVTDDGEGNVLTFGYGRGYNVEGDDGKALFKIKRTSNSSQKIITRLRAMGSTRNMPYRYYFKKYELPQSMVVSNLQLPDTFETPANKAVGNETRDTVYGHGSDGLPNLRHVLGETNDAYIDKNDDALNCNDGVREGAAFWDGTDSDLEEIYPTIKSGTYFDLRGAAIPDKDGTTGSSAYPNYGDTERIDEVLAIDEQTTNIGDGILAESDATGQQELSFDVARSDKTETVYATTGDATYPYLWSGEAVNLFVVNQQQSPGTYLMAASASSVFMKIYAQSGWYAVGYELNLWEMPSDGSEHRHIGTYRKMVRVQQAGNIPVMMPDLPDVRDDMKTGEPPTTQVEKIELKKKSTVKVTILPLVASQSPIYGQTTIWGVLSARNDVQPTYVWKPTAATDLFVNQPFYLYLKDMGIDMKHLQTTGEDATIHFNTGQCGGMEFKFNPNNVEDAVIGNKKGWKVQINERFIDKTLNIYYPNANSAILPGDQYVLLNIEFPEIYIKLAEIRLLNAATKYLADNCETKYTYEPEVSDIYLQQNIDRCEDAGDITKSIYWNLYAGYKFTMYGIPTSDSSPLPVVSNITIQTVVIKEGEKYIPQVEIVLNNDIEQSTIKKLTMSVDRIYNSVFSVGNFINGGISGGGSSSVIPKLSELRDVTFPTPLRDNDCLVWSGDKWVNANISGDIDALEARMDDAELALIALDGHKHDWGDLVNKPNLVEGIVIGGNRITFRLTNGDTVTANFSEIPNKITSIETTLSQYALSIGGNSTAIGNLQTDVSLLMSRGKIVRLDGIVSNATVEQVGYNGSSAEESTTHELCIDSETGMLLLKVGTVEIGVVGTFSYKFYNAWENAGTCKSRSFYDTDIDLFVSVDSDNCTCWYGNEGRLVPTGAGGDTSELELELADEVLARQNADLALSGRVSALESGAVTDVMVNGSSVKSGTTANIPITAEGNGTVNVGNTTLDVHHQHDWSDVKNAPNMLTGIGVGMGAIEFYHRNGDVSKVENVFFSSVSVRINPGYGVPSASATYADGILTIILNNIQGEQGVKGDTVILDPDGVSSYTLYDVTGYNVDGAMTQAAVTAALTAKMDVEADTNNDFSVKDEEGNAIVTFNGGNVQTKNFDSGKAPQTEDSVSDFSIRDESGNDIVRFENGHIRTKNFDSENIEIEHPVEVENGNYDFSVEDENGNSILRVGQGHIKTKYFDSSNFGASNKIYCVGDSTTQGQSGIDNPRDDNESSASANCYPNRLQDMLGDQWEVVNLGAGGQNTGEVLARCGWLDLITPTQFTLYGNGTTSLVCSGSQADKTSVLVDSCAQEPANYFLQQGSTDAMAQMSICYVLGVQCALSVSSSNIYIRRTSSVSYDLTIPSGTHITLGGCKGNGIYLLRVGSNDAMRMLSATDIDNYIAKIKQAASRMEGGRYVVMGMFHGYEPGTTEQVKWSAMNARLSQEFGARYIDGQSYITSTEAFAALGITPTQDSDISSARAAQGVKSDAYCMTNGITPSSFWRASYTPNRQSVDKIHLNYDGYWLMAKMFYDKLVQLNWI